MSALVWLGVAILFVIAEMMAGELVLLMLGGGALAAAGVALLDPPLWVEVVVFAVISVLLLVGVRPVAKRHLMSRPRVLTNTEALTGRQALVTEPVDEHDGRVKIGGEVWSARALNPGETLAPGEHVTVVEIDGATAVVWRV
ncbi:NfeD family protein [Gordonia sp. ABSL1-1]|uniref:NfeD family protein n=1 Tax=Gordonia sp. ABSL1-1 TaxID=3053923 RepID=UPI00257345D0|nr:NfeD family protein [Gordonia sp. ABSL1-1]MDL9935857.1 NfeD family protein [Gordonia sp. ABSL1-1]